jgi:beta-lactamase regulating signal transducer with metallopeptidase domain
VTHVLSNRYAIVVGWMLLLALWETSAIAVALASVRVAWPSSRAECQYRVACSALGLAVLLALLNPVLLVSLRVPARAPLIHPSHIGSVAGDLTPAGAALPAAFPSVWPGIPALQPSQIDGALAIVAIVWAAGVSLLLLRLTGGWLMSRSLAGRAHTVEDDETRQGASDIAHAAGVSVPVIILESSEVDAPVVLGWRRPTLIVPRAALLRLTREQMRGLLAHEFAHIRRGDYFANVLQSLAELPFFFTPAVGWISRCIREAREFCCDDEAAVRVRDRVHYVEALTTLAALGTINGTRAAVGSSGPRLITRVRRLLQEDPMPQLRSLRLVMLGGAQVLIVITGMQVSAASAARLSDRGRSTGQESVPFGYAPDQQGSGVHLKVVRGAAGAPAFAATLQNVSSEPIVGVRFVAAVERHTGSGSMPVQLLTSEEIPVALLPGQSAHVAPAVLTQKQLDDLGSDPSVRMLQYFVGLGMVRFANGHVWSISPNPNATDGAAALTIPSTFYPRALIDRDAKKTQVANAACGDDADRTTSHGGVIAILNEPGHFMRCDSGRWIDGPALPAK